MITNNVFVSVGGHNNTNIPYCEKYSMDKDKWEELPLLNRARSFVATVLYKDRYLYAIGGKGCGCNCMEVLDPNEKGAHWRLASFKAKDMAFDESPLAFVI